MQPFFPPPFGITPILIGTFFRSNDLTNLAAFSELSSTILLDFLDTDPNKPVRIPKMVSYVHMSEKTAFQEA